MLTTRVAFQEVQFRKSTAKKPPTYTLHSWFNWISYQNDLGFTQEGDVTSAAVNQTLFLWEQQHLPSPFSFTNAFAFTKFLEHKQKSIWLQNMHH